MCVEPKLPPPEAYHARRSTRWLDSCIRLVGGGLPIDLAPVPDLENLDRTRTVVDQVDDSVRPLADAIALVRSGKLLAAVWPRIRAESGDPGDDSGPDSPRRDGRELLGSGRLDEDPIARHAAGEP